MAGGKHTNMNNVTIGKFLDSHPAPLATGPQEHFNAKALMATPHAQMATQDAGGISPRENMMHRIAENNYVTPAAPTADVHQHSDHQHQQHQSHNHNSKPQANSGGGRKGLAAAMNRQQANHLAP